ncbi:MAG: universal stress protein [Gemmatimonadota bacterium]|nr:universal stress protein [Gemmatimonadota bacterium]
MFRRLLVPVDLTPKNRRAVEVARDLALQWGGEVHLVHVIETLDLPFEELADFYDRLERRATAKLTPLARIVDEADVPVTVHILYGKRAETVIEFADEHDVDLIILDSHRIVPGKPGKGLGTLSYQIAIVAPSPVLLVKGGSNGESTTPGDRT